MQGRRALTTNRLGVTVPTELAGEEFLDPHPWAVPSGARHLEQHDYPFEEFLGHFRAMKYVGKYETVRIDYNDDGPPLEAGDDHSLEMNMGRILDYFAQLGYPKEKTTYQAPRLAHLLSYLVCNAESFARAQLVVFGDEDGSSLVKEPLLQVLHEHFAGPGLPKETTVEALVARAREIEATEDGNSEAGD